MPDSAGESEIIVGIANTLQGMKCKPGCEVVSPMATFAKSVATVLKHGERRMGNIETKLDSIDSKLSFANKFNPKDLYGWIRLLAAIGLLILIMINISDRKDRANRDKAIDTLLQIQGMGDLNKTQDAIAGKGGKT
jgi:hypothetical protein